MLVLRNYRVEAKLINQNHSSRDCSSRKVRAFSPLFAVSTECSVGTGIIRIASSLFHRGSGYTSQWAR